MLENSPPISSTPVSVENDQRKKLQPHVAIFVEENGGDWHARRLVDAIERRGARVTTTTLKHCAFDTEAASGLSIPGFDGEIPNGVFVRSISKGTLEQITLRLGILHALQESGTRVWNDARVIERCVDKSTTTFLLQRASLPVPHTLTTEQQVEAKVFAEKNTILVSKPLFGSQGNGIKRIEKVDDLPPPDDLGHVYYLQEYLRSTTKSSYQDWRVLVSAGNVVASMARQGDHWVTNVHQGGKPAEVEPDPNMHSLAIKAAAAVGADYAGVDLIKAPNGSMMILEINSNPAWKGIQSVTEVDVADRLASDFLNAVMTVPAT